MINKERKLTEAELKRKEKFDKICDEMNNNGYVRTDLTVSVAKANIMAFIVMLPFEIILFIFYCIFVPIYEQTFYFKDCIILFILLFAFIVLHECIHGLTWGIFTENHLKSIDFGLIKKALTPYCTCSEPLKKQQYILGTAMPTIILGFIPAVISICISSYLLFFLSMIMIFSGGGDFFIILKILMHNRRYKDAVYYDHPYECGVVVFEK